MRSALGAYSVKSQPGISANSAEIPHKKRRGRPSLVPEEQRNRWLATGLFDTTPTSDRGRRDAVYFRLAIEWLRSMETFGEDFSVLLGTREQRRSPRFRPSKTLLIELYKIREQDRLDAARRLCASPPLRQTLAAKEMRRERLRNKERLANAQSDCATREIQPTR